MRTKRPQAPLETVELHETVDWTDDLRSRRRDGTAPSQLTKQQAPLNVLLLERRTGSVGKRPRKLLIDMGR